MTPSAYLLRSLVPPGILLALGLGAVWGPWSPLAMDRANARYLAGDLDRAQALYEEVAEGWHFPATRAEAAMRAGLLHAQLGAVEQGVKWLRRAVDLEPDRARRGALRAQLAAMLAPDAPAEAAALYEQAALDSGSGRALVEAAQIWEAEEKLDRALVAWQAAIRRLGPTDAEALALAREGLARVEARIDGAVGGAE